MRAGPATASLREQQAELTRELILRALAEHLLSERAGQFSMPDVARKAGVSLRTVYRHFPTRDELLAAATDWIDERFFGEVPFAQTVEDIPKLFRYACEQWGEHPTLARAMARSHAGGRDRLLQRRLAVIHRALAKVTDELPEHERRKAVAVLGYLENVLAWVTMRDAIGLEEAEVADAVEWAMSTLIEDMRRRNALARREGPPDHAGSRRLSAVGRHG